MQLNFPCDVGDTIYVVCGFSCSEYKIDDFVYDGNFIWCHASNPKYASEHRNIYRCISYDLGKTIFLDKNEAENKTGL